MIKTNINTPYVNEEDSSNIEFLERDIASIKERILKALDRDDANLHNKWMNNLRDALELKNKLENKTDTYNNNTYNINIDKEFNAEELLNKFTNILIKTSPFVR